MLLRIITNWTYGHPGRQIEVAADGCASFGSDKEFMQSDIIKKGISRAPARAMLKGTGLTDADLAKPLVAIANTWTEVTPCNLHLRALAEKVKAGVRAAGGTPIEFDTITISDGITMGTEGMKASLISREVIADSIETVVGCAGMDGYVAIGGCDKNMPGALMAIARMNRPAVFVYGGTILPGCITGDTRKLDVVSVFEAIGAHANHKISDKANLFTRFSLNQVNGPTTNPDQTAIDPDFGIKFFDHQRNAAVRYTRVISPRMTLTSCGSSSIRVARMKRPTRVTRGS